MPSTTVKPFFSAIRAGDLAGVRALAAADPSLLRAHDPECFGAVPLTAAMYHRSMVDLLLELGADIDQKSDWWAGGFGVLDSADAELAGYLLTRGATLTPHAAARLGMIDELRAMLAADPVLVHARGGDGQMPLHFASTPEIAGLLLDHGAMIEAKDIDHASTAAQYLATSHPRTAAFLVSRGARADLFLAALIGDVALLERLLADEPGGERAAVSRQRFPAPAPAAGHIYLYTIGEGCTLLHAAARVGGVGVIRWLSARGAAVSARGGYDDATPLHVAAWNDQPGAAGALLDAGAEINAKSGRMHDNEPLGWAIVGGAPGVVRLLLERGARVGPHHRKDATAGAAGAFRSFRGGWPMERWKRVAELMESA